MVILIDFSDSIDISSIIIYTFPIPFKKILSEVLPTPKHIHKYLFPEIMGDNYRKRQKYYKMEYDIYRKKVSMHTLASNFINYQPQLQPQWISQSHINFVSAYQFGSYDIEQQYMQVIAREQGCGEVISFWFASEVNQHNCQVYYICGEEDCFYLFHLQGPKNGKVLLYKNNGDKKKEMVFDFYDFFIADQEELKSSRSLATKTQKLIEDINQGQEQADQTLHDISGVRQMQVISAGNFVMVIVEMKNRTGVMMVNVGKCQKQKKKDFSCSVRPTSLRKHTPELSAQENQAARIIYLFPENIVKLYKTKDITRYIIHTQNSVLLVKICFQLMELSVLFRLEVQKREKVVSMGVAVAGEDEMLLILIEADWGREMRMYYIEDKKLLEVRESKSRQYQNEIDRELSRRSKKKNKNTVKFNENVVESRYQLEQEQAESEEEDFSGGIIIAVYNKMAREEQGSQKLINSQKEMIVKKSAREVCTLRDIEGDGGLEMCELGRIVGFTVNKDTLVLWEGESVMHFCRIMSRKEQEDRKRSQIQNDRSEKTMRMLKENQLKEVYSQLTGIQYRRKRTPTLKFKPKITYLSKVDLQLTYRKISKLSLSPSNSNLLVISSSQNKDAVQFNLFQLDLFKQLGQQDAAIFLKPIKNVFKPKVVDSISGGLVKEGHLFMTGNMIHSHQSQLLEGALSFDLHPLNLLMAVSFGFAVKVYAIQGSQKLTSLFTVNGQGLKQVKYSPLGNHLCILSSKTIKILDAYSYTVKHIVHQKVSNLVRCAFSSNGHQFYTLTQNHQFTIYNTFDYNKMDSIKPLANIQDFKLANIKSYLKAKMYCCLLQNGGLYVRFKQGAVVVSQQILYSYDDGEKITCLQIDEKSGVLFCGCRSGKVRAHIWPVRETDTFEYYSEIRVSFAGISSLRLSSLSQQLYVGSQNGNISKVKYSVDREKGFGGDRQRNLLMMDKNFVNVAYASSVQKLYRFVLQNATMVGKDELPDKVCMQFKLSEVIQKLKDEMRKLKSNIREELDEKSKMTLEKVDFGLLHHMNHMIATKLYNQLRDDIEDHKKEIRQSKVDFEEEFGQVMRMQGELIKEKSFKTSDFSKEREILKGKLATQIISYKKQLEAELSKFREKKCQAEAMANQSEQDIYFLPNQQIAEYQEMKQKLQKDLLSQNKKHYELKKECAYKETAIRGMRTKRIKQESLEFKFKLEQNQMEKKLRYNEELVEELRDNIEVSEQKVNQIQRQAYIIKNNAQYKKIAGVDEMIDACSYKLWTKDRMEQEEILQCSINLKNMVDLLEVKGEEVTDLIASNQIYEQKLVQIKSYLHQKRDKLNLAKIGLLNSRRRLARFNPFQYLEEFKEDRKKSKENKGRKKKEGKTARKTVREKNHQRSEQARLSCKIPITDREVQKINSSRILYKINKEQPMFHKLIDKEGDCLKVNIRNHNIKVKKLGRQNGRILQEFERLKFQKKHLWERQKTAQTSLQKLQRQEELQRQLSPQYMTNRPTVQLSKTSYQKYIQLKSAKTKCSPKYLTATSTPKNEFLTMNQSQIDSFDMGLA